MTIFKAIRRLWAPLEYYYKVPRWVRNFPYQADRTGLERLALSTKGRLSHPREMVFVLSNFSGKDSVENAIFAIEQNDWSCKALPQEGAPGKTVLECRRLDYEITEESYGNDCAYFNRIALLYGADSDGWYAGGRPKMQERTRRMLQAGLVVGLIALGIGIRIVIAWYVVAVLPSHAQPSTAVHTNTGPVAATDPSPAPLADTDPKKLAPHDMLAETPGGMMQFTSQAMGVSVRYPDSWMFIVSQPCVDGQAGDQTCQVQLLYKNWHQRYVPTILLSRIQGSIQTSQTKQDKLFTLARYQDPNILVTKENVQVSGQPAVKYTEVSYGTTTELLYVQAGDSVFLLQGDTPKSQPADMDYFKVVHDIADSIVVNR